MAVADDLAGCVVTQGDAVVIAILVQPRASNNMLCGVQGQELKVRLTSPPVDGAANTLCCTFFAKLLRCPKSAVTLLSGHKSRHKRLRIEGVSPCDVFQSLNQLLVE